MRDVIVSVLVSGFVITLVLTFWLFSFKEVQRVIHKEAGSPCPAPIFIALAAAIIWPIALAVILYDDVRRSLERDGES